MNTVLHQLKEDSPYMMSFVIVTKKNNVIVIDGGRPEDIPALKCCIAGRHILAWILTHAHDDHISGFVHEFETNGGKDFDIEKIYYHFPPYSMIDTPVQNPEFFRQELNEILPAFDTVLPKFADKAHIIRQGEQLQIDEVIIDFLFTWHKELTCNLMNDASLVFKLTTEETSVLFLGDLGPEGGDTLYRESRHLLQADMVQMAHHGHMNCGMEVYAAIGAKTCFWCCPQWLYEEEELPEYLCDPEDLRINSRQRMYGTAVTRNWMNLLGADKHYVSYDGPHCVTL